MGFTIKNTANRKDIFSVHFGDTKSKNNVSMSGGSLPLVVRGQNGAKYKIKVEKKSSLTSDITHASGYYSFTTKNFSTIPTDGSSVSTGVIANGYCTHFIMFPETTSDVRYDVIVDPVVDGVIATMEDAVPVNPGDFTIIQYGTRTLTLEPTRYNTGNFGTMPSSLTVTRPKRYKGDKYSLKRIRPYFGTGGTGGASSTRLILDAPVEGISPGMIVTCSSIPAGITIKSIKEKIITLSSACTIANNTSLRFDINNNRLVPFSFTIPPHASTTINNTAGADVKSAIRGLQGVARLKTAQVHSNVKIIVVDDTRDLEVGMTIGDIGTTYSSTGSCTVAAITNFTTFTVNENLTTADDVEFNAYAYPTGSRVLSGTANPEVEVVHMHLDDSSSNVVITGYLDVPKIENTATARLYIEDIITVT